MKDTTISIKNFEKLVGIASKIKIGFGKYGERVVFIFNDENLFEIYHLNRYGLPELVQDEFYYNMNFVKWDLCSYTDELWKKRYSVKKWLKGELSIEYFI